jgi:hypothetical protein
MNINEEIKRIKEIIGIEGDDDKSTTCPKCDHSWDIEKSDPDPYLCHMCGYDQSSGEHEFDKLAKWEKENGINENDDEDDYNPEDDYLFDTRGDLIELKKELIKSGVTDNTRLHLTHDNDLKKMDTKQRAGGPKPMGLWYAVGFGWLDFTTNEHTSFYQYDDVVHAFEISLDGLNVLRITNYDELVEFEKQYVIPKDGDYSVLNGWDINWAKVAETYDGIEIAPYIYKARMTHKWYYGWDVASGCIWNTSSLKYRPILHK